MNRWHWHLQRLISAFGMPGLAGLGLLLAAAALQLAVVRQDLRDIAGLEAELTQLRSHPQTSRQYAPAEELALFYDFFPERTALARQLRTVHQLVEKHGLAIERADYKLSHVAGTPLWRYQMNFPLMTDYGTLRHYVAAVLEALPNAALEDIELQRYGGNQDVLDAKVSLVLYFRGTP